VEQGFRILLALPDNRLDELTAMERRGSLNDAEVARVRDAWR